MKSIYVFCLFILLGGVFGCKKDSAAKMEETPASTQQDKAQPANSAPDAQSNTSATGGHDFTILTDKIFIIKNSFGGTKQAEPPYKDQWFDLTPDGKFTAGKLKDQTHKGAWNYNENTKILLLKPDNNKFKTTEWNVMYNNQMMVWIGTQTYGDNAVQIQLVRVAELPF